MAVTSRDIPAKGERTPEKAEAAKPRPPSSAAGAMWALGVFAVLLGALLWLIGARYTLEGIVYALNLALELARLPARVPTPAGWWWALALPFGLVYSVAEVRIPFGPPRSAAALPAWLLMLVALAVVHASDVGSTFLGYLAPTPAPWPMHAWAARAMWPLFIWAALLTYLPERLILAGWRWIFGIRR